MSPPRDEPPSAPVALQVWRRALTLAAALLAAKAALIGLRLLDGGGSTLASPLSVPALLHQDVVLVVIFASADAALSVAAARLGGRRVGSALCWSLVAALVIYAAFNVAVARLFSTPLTWSMLGATGGALLDSILAYVTLGNVAAILGVCLVAAVVGWRVRRVPGAWPRALLALGAIALLLAGPTAAARVDTLGLHRNALVALVVTAAAARAPVSDELPNVPALTPEGPALDLTHLRGAARGRSVIWVILESTGARYLGSYGHVPDPTPELTRFAEHALRFDAAYAVQPESIKGLYTMLCATPTAPETRAADYTERRQPCASIAGVLRARGYRTGFFHSGRFRYLGMQGILDDRGFDELADAATIGGEHVSSFGTDDASTVRRVLSFVSGLGTETPFFAVYSPISGHHPYKSPGTGPRPFPANSDFDHYLNDLHAGDAAFGALVRGIRELGRERDVLWAIVGDHGQAFGEHEGNFAHTLFLYEENVHVPMLFVAPGSLSSALRAPQISSLIDLAPATLELLGLPIPESYRGRSPLLPSPSVARFFTDHGPTKLGLRQGSWKVLHETEHDRTRLFDLSTDPGELHDVAGKHPERARLYREHLRAFAAAERARVLR
ncbi:MAG: sulfatase-like hydrolase/transferase [Polyangiaceae bacterium]|nr:sulfatase-like hydrolase/transferase [Polyangiaceae bacterium]